jgi:hypothetical protein
VTDQDTACHALEVATQLCISKTTCLYSEERTTNQKNLMTCGPSTWLRQFGSKSTLRDSFALSLEVDIQLMFLETTWLFSAGSEM